LTNADADQRQKRYGFNEVVPGRRSGLLRHATSAMINPLVILLGVLTLISLSVGDVRAAVIMALMVVLGVSLRFVQEWRADAAAAQHTAMVHTTATVVREGAPGMSRCACWCRVISSDSRPAISYRPTCA
jgi:Mg2+-importing ATPase